VTTPSAKADGFCRHARTTVPRFAGNAQSERQDITGSVDITVKYQSAMRAIMNTGSKGFWNIRQATATGTYLRCVPGVYLDKLPTSFLHFVGEFGEEHSPSRIADRLGKHPASQPLDIQVLNGNKAVVICYLPTDLVVKVGPLVPDMSVSLLEQPDGLASAVTAFLASGYASLCNPECCLAIPVVTRVLYQLTIGKSCERRESYIYPDSTGQRFSRRNIHDHAEIGVPLTSLALESQCLNLADNRPVHLQLDETDTLQLEPARISEVAAISPSGEGVTVKTVPALEPGIAGLLSSLHTSEERPEGLIDTPEHVLASREVGKAKVACIPYLFKLVGLVIVVARYAVTMPRISTLLERRVIQGPGFGQLVLQSLSLLSRGVKPVFESATHLLALLPLNVFPDCRLVCQWFPTEAIYNS